MVSGCACFLFCSYLCRSPRTHDTLFGGGALRHTPPWVWVNGLWLVRESSLHRPSTARSPETHVLLVLSFGAFRNHPYIGLLLPSGRTSSWMFLYELITRSTLAHTGGPTTQPATSWLHAPTGQGTFRSASLHRPWAVLSALRIVHSGCSLASARPEA